MSGVTGSSTKRGRAGRCAAGAALAIYILGLLGACTNPTIIDPARRGPFYYPLNHAGEAAIPQDVRRVVLLPMCRGNVTTPEMAGALDPVLAAELLQQNRFEMVALSREECRRRFGVEEFSSVAALPPSLFPALRRDLAADAVLFVDLTAYRAYRPLAIGWRGKLVNLADARVIWTFDNIFAADVPGVANSARHFFLDRDQEKAPSDFTEATLQSPTRFASYAASAMWTTLPPVVPGRLAEPIASKRDKAH